MLAVDSQDTVQLDWTVPETTTVEPDPRIEKLIQFEMIDQTFAKQLIESCEAKTENANLCLKHIIGVTSAESSVFKRCKYNNCFWLMKCDKWGCTLRRFNSKIEAVNGWLDNYNKRNRSQRVTGQKWLNGKYCASACTYWVSNYNSAISKLNLE